MVFHYGVLYAVLAVFTSVLPESGVGAGIDSYYEYMFKAYVLLGDETYLDRFNKVIIVCSLNHPTVSVCRDCLALSDCPPVSFQFIVFDEL